MPTAEKATHQRTPGMEKSGHDITNRLNAWSSGDEKAGNELFALIYPTLRRLAHQQLSKSGYHLTGVTEVVHETYVKLASQNRCHWRCRAQFLALASTMIRRFLLDHAKSIHRRKRGSHYLHLNLEEAALPGVGPAIDMLVLDHALVALARIQVTASRIVELRIFAGLSVEETAGVLGISRRTVLRKWHFAKAWLAQHLSNGK